MLGPCGKVVAMTDPSSQPMPEHETPCEERNCLVASVVLVDPRGWLLLQERDEHAPIAPNQWGLVGGHVDEGESWDEALARELDEETGLRAEALDLELWFDEVVQHSPKRSSHLADHWRIWVGRTELTDDDIEVGEGRQIVFVDPGALARLDLAPASSYLLPKLLESDVYKRLAR